MPAIERELFGHSDRGEAVTRYSLTNARGSVARLIDYGATLTELWVPDRSGVLGDVVLGFDSLDEYLCDRFYLGATIGRVANRTAGARFELDGVEYPLAANDGPNHLHGGRRGFDKALWESTAFEDPAGPCVRFNHTSVDGDEGYPGTLEVALLVRLDHDDALHFEYEARTDGPTPVNLTQHSYWNLAGRGDVLAHELELRAERYTEVGPDAIPTGRLLPVGGTPFDFRRAKRLGRDIGELARGYDHNYVLADVVRTRATLAGELRDPLSGRRMRVSTTEPGVQVYSANRLNGLPGKRGALYPRHAALCLEMQHFPDAIHHSHFPSAVLRPGETYRQQTIHSFASD